jgi:hypothetical protein
MPFYERWMNILFWCLCACVGIGGWMAWSGAEQQDSDFMVQGLIFAGVTGGVAMMLLVIYLRRVQPIVTNQIRPPGHPA